MVGDVREAMLAFQRRKSAADPLGAIHATHDELRAFGSRLGVGLDVDLDEVLAVSAVFIPAYEAIEASGFDRGIASQGAWLDGFYTGLILAQRREERS